MRTVAELEPVWEKFDFKATDRTWPITMIVGLSARLTESCVAKPCPAHASLCHFAQLLQCQQLSQMELEVRKGSPGEKPQKFVTGNLGPLCSRLRHVQRCCAAS
jgi:hypothetical protein